MLEREISIEKGPKSSKRVFRKVKQFRKNCLSNFVLLKSSKMSEILRHEVALAYDVWSKCYDRNDNPTRDISLKVLQSDFVEKELNKIEKLQILEVGCGTGRNTEFLIEKFSPKISNYVALDISDGMMEIARQKIKNLSSDHSTGKKNPQSPWWVLWGRQCPPQPTGGHYHLVFQL